jgi:hypothetical protein
LEEQQIVPILGLRWDSTLKMVSPHPQTGIPAQSHKPKLLKSNHPPSLSKQTKKKVALGKPMIFAIFSECFRFQLLHCRIHWIGCQKRREEPKPEPELERVSLISRLILTAFHYDLSA